MNADMLAAVVGLSLVAGCSSVRHTATGERIHSSGSRAHDRKAQALTLTVERARGRVAAYLTATRPPAASPKLGHHIGIHQVIFGDSLVFAMPHMKDVVLSGYSVDGHTGAVTEDQEGVDTLPDEALRESQSMEAHHDGPVNRRQPACRAAMRARQAGSRRGPWHSATS